jgi:hypothetical protein
MSKEIDPGEAVEFIYKHAPAFAQAKAERVYLEEFRKSKKAILMAESGAKTAAEREQFAYAHPEYQTLLDGLRVAVEREEDMRWRLVAAQARVEIWRTESANNRRMDRAAA